MTWRIAAPAPYGKFKLEGCGWSSITDSSSPQLQEESAKASTSAALGGGQLVYELSAIRRKVPRAKP